MDDFNLILEQLQKKNTYVSDFLGKHVHWGYWPTPINNELKVAVAVENLSIELCHYAQIKSDQSILDIGCGFGGTVSYLNDNFSNLYLLGLNIDARQLALAEQKIHVLNNNKLSFVQDDACSMKHVHGNFDHIIAIESIFYFSSRVKFFEQSLTHLKQAGSITISDFIISPFLIPTCKLLKIFKCKWLHPFGSLNFITLKKYYDLCDQFNLKIEVYDITENTMPTYSILKKLTSEFEFNALRSFLWKRGCNFLKLLTRMGLNRYLIIKFTKL